MTSFGPMDETPIGHLYNTNDYTIDNYCAIEDIEFGRPVIRVVTDKTTRQTQVKNWTNMSAIDAGFVFAGISVFTYLSPNPYNSSSGGSKIQTKSQGNFIRFGDVKVLASVAINAGDFAYIDVSNGTFTNVGENNLRIGRFLTSTSDVNQAVQLYINF
jgi:hypothetical protein